MPGYTGSNSYLFQRAISIAVDDLFRHVLKQRQSAFIDGTLADFDRPTEYDSSLTSNITPGICIWNNFIYLNATVQKEIKICTTQLHYRL
ncbi:hypothetical protein KC947_02385 [Candidatus Saccharibacteria bacterium]|nr:hypothetical protein [Candidatus Saccharibacteria bacterium]